jgi:PilZ domain
MSAPADLPVDPECRVIRRSDPRVRLGVPAKVQFLSGLKSCSLDNLSQRGARIVLAERAPPIGTSGLLQVCKIEAFGEVIWSRGMECGLRFDDKLALKQVVTVRHFSDQQVEIEAAGRRTMVRNFVQGRRGP